MKYIVYAFNENKWIRLDSFTTQEEARVFADAYYKEHRHNTVIEVEDGGKH